MHSKIYSLFTQLCHFGYKTVRLTYDGYKKIKASFKCHDLNPYKYISLYPTDLTIDIVCKQYQTTTKPPKYTIITPVFNEEHNIIDVLQSIESQTLPPDQVIIIDAESTDNTLKNIEKYKKSSKLHIDIITSSKRNIGYQRNLGITKSRNNLIVNADAGTCLDKNYALNMIGPFAENKNLDLVSGIHYPKNIYPWSVHFSSEARFYSLNASGACLAYKRDMALKAGGYPEYMTYAGEDTLFCYRYKKLSSYWMFNKKAFILWEHPTTFKNAQTKVMNYMMANFEIGLWPYFVNGSRFQIPIWLGYFFKIFRERFPTLPKCQTDLEINKRHIKGLKFILSKSRITDPNNTKFRDIATSFIADNYKVFFIDFSTSPPEDITSVFIDTDHSLLELIHHRNFHPSDFQKRYGDFIENTVFILEYSDDVTMDNIKTLQKEFSAIKVEQL